MSEAQRIHDVILPQAFAILPQKPAMSSPAARLALITIGFQETKFETRRQIISKMVDGKKKLVPEGPASSYWQFEKGGGIKGVMNHASSRDAAFKVCTNRGVVWDRDAIWEAMATDDVLGACFARLLLWTNPKSLPAVGEEDLLWNLYAYDLWRPGKPHPEDWPAAYANARKVCGL